MTVFRFKQFVVNHENASMKVGTDAVLLGAWTSVSNVSSILDIGTGTGIIALMLAQRSSSSASIDALEITEADAHQAGENVNNSPWKEKIKVHAIPVQQYTPPSLYDLIVSNPPYFTNSYAPLTSGRTHARHAITLTHEDLLEATQRLLSPVGRLSVILPYTEGLQFIDQASHFALHCIRKTTFQSRPHKPVERLLLEFSAQYLELETNHLIHYEENDWTRDYKVLTQDFYLNL